MGIVYKARKRKGESKGNRIGNRIRSRKLEILFTRYNTTDSSYRVDTVGKTTVGKTNGNRNDGKMG